MISDANLAETCEEMTRSMLADAGVTATYADELPPQAWWDTVKPRRHKPELQVPWYRIIAYDTAPISVLPVGSRMCSPREVFDGA